MDGCRWFGLGWDGIDFGYGVATALEIVQWPLTHLIFVTTMTTAGCVKNSVKCKIFWKEIDLTLPKMCDFTQIVKF